MTSRRVIEDTRQQINREADGAAPFVPATRHLDALAQAARSCTGCPLFADTTQVVFGSGTERSRLVLVGEQPGDQEDTKGRPFVGPAGRVLWQCLEAAGVPSREVYVTNAVKHFKHEMRGKRRIHQKPNTAEIEACHPWLQAELDALESTVVVALGATAARSLLGKPVTISAARSAPTPFGSRQLFVTYHPSAVLRADDRAEEVRAALVTDLTHAWKIASAA
jgi:DNA polymerase